MGEARPRRRATDAFVVPAARIGEPPNRISEQVFEQLAAGPQVALALVLAKDREVVVGETMRAEMDAGIAHFQYLVWAQGCQRLTRRFIDPIKREAGRREGSRGAHNRDRRAGEGHTGVGGGGSPRRAA